MKVFAPHWFNAALHRSRIGIGEFSDRAPVLLTFALAVFVFSLPFESIGNDVLGEAGRITRYTGYLMFLVAAVHARLCFARPGPVVFLFGFYVLLRLFWLLDPQQDAMLLLTTTITLVQLVTMFWICANLFRQQEYRNVFMIVLFVGCTARAAMMLAGVNTEVLGHDDRVTVKGEDANFSAAVFVMGALAAMSVCQVVWRRRPAALLLVLPALLLVMQAMLKTGSRGATVAAVAGMMVFVFCRRRLLESLAMLPLVGLAIGVLFVGILQNEKLMDRWMRTVEKGEMANREHIFPMAASMIAEKPVAGWGPEYRRPLARRSGDSQMERDAHNLVLHLLLESGAVGALLYLAGVCFCVKASVSGYRRSMDALPLALVVALLFVNMSVPYHSRKTHWLVLAFAAGSGFAARQKVTAIDGLRRESPVFHFPVRSALGRLACFKRIKRRYDWRNAFGNSPRNSVRRCWRTLRSARDRL